MRPGLVELEDNHILWSVLAFTWAVFIWDTYITLRQVFTPSPIYFMSVVMDAPM